MCCPCVWVFELSELMVDKMVPEAAAAPMLSKFMTVTVGASVEVNSEPVEPGMKEPRIRVTRALISSVIRFIRSRMLLKNVAPGILELDTDAVADTCVEFWPGVPAN